MAVLPYNVVWCSMVSCCPAQGLQPKTSERDPWPPPFYFLFGTGFVPQFCGAYFLLAVSGPNQPLEDDHHHGSLCCAAVCRHRHAQPPLCVMGETRLVSVPRPRCGSMPFVRVRGLQLIFMASRREGLRQLRSVNSCIATQHIALLVGDGGRQGGLFTCGGTLGLTAAKF